MTRLSTILILLFATLSVFGQKPHFTPNYQAADFFFETQSHGIGADQISEADLPAFLKEKGRYGPDISLKLSYKIKSKALTHYRYNLYKNEVRIYGAEAHAGIDDIKKIRVCTLPVLPRHDSEKPFPAESIAESVRSNAGAFRIVKAEEVWFTDNTDYLKKGLAVELSGPETFHQEVLVDGNEIIAQYDLLRYLHGPNDSVVSVKVFAPDPLTTAQVSYGSPYTDNSDFTVPELEAERQTKSLVVAYENGLYKAKNDYVEILDFSPPNIAPVTSSTKQMHYTRDLDGFEDMNVMFHITNHKEHMINLGYPDLPDYIIEVDAHAINGSDQSFFSTATYPGRLYFGEGGVDDAEDADVIIHEYTHAIIYVAAPSGATSTERGCIEEALGDYFAASYSNSFNSYNGHRVFNWDGHNEFWPGREVESQKDYGQSSFKNGNIYGNTDLFASPLMELNRRLGRNTADALILEAIYNLGNNTTMVDMAGYISLSDSLLNAGINHLVIAEAFAKRNIVPNIGLNELQAVKNKVQVYNTLAFASGGPVMIQPQDVQIASYRFNSLSGQLISAKELSHSRGEVIEISSPALQSGVYLLTLATSEGFQLSYKLMRIN